MDAQSISSSSPVEFEPLKYVPVFGTSSSVKDFAGSTLVIPSISAGFSPMIATDLYILNEGFTKAGFIKSEYISPLVQNDTMKMADEAGGQIAMPVTLWRSPNSHYTFLIMRSGVTAGNGKKLGAALTSFIKEAGFKQVFLLSSTMSPVRRDRGSNRDIPNVWAYVNNVIYKKYINGPEKKSYYETHQIQKFGNWLGDSKKKPHQELKELAFAGSVDKLMKDFNKTDIPVQCFLIFTPGGLDFTGGYTYYQFLKNNFDQNGEAMAGKALGQVSVPDGYKSGEEIHEKFFVEKTHKMPEHWAQMVSYF